LTIGRITIDGSVTTYSDPSIHVPTEIATGPDGALWFTNAGSDPANNTIGRITTAGVVSSYGDPSISGPDGITAGPDGGMWFTNARNNTIGRIQAALDPAALLAALFGAVTDPPVGPGTSLGDKIATAELANTQLDTRATCAALGSFEAEVRAQTGKSIPSGSGPSQSGGLLSAADQIAGLIGCPT